MSDSPSQPPLEGEGQSLTEDALAALDSDNKLSDKDVKVTPADVDAASESDISEIDENLFKDYDANEARPVIAIDETTVQKLGVHRRKRDANEAADDGEQTAALAKRRRMRNRRGEDDVGAAAAKRGKKKGKERAEVPMTEKEKKIAELNARIDAAIGKGKKKKKKGKQDREADLGNFQDDFIADLRERMIQAARADYEDVRAGKAATHKIRMLEEVKNSLRPNLLSSQLDNDFLTAVRFWLEPLENKALPAYSIQKELFTWLSALNPSTDLLRESKIGRIVACYTKDIRPQRDIKRMAELMVRDWSRPILGKSDNYKELEFETREYDPASAIATHREDEGDGPPTEPRRRFPSSVPPKFQVVPKTTLAAPASGKRGQKAGDDLMKRIRARALMRKKLGPSI